MCSDLKNSLKSLNILRTIATTTLNDAFELDNACLVWLFLENGANDFPTTDKIFQNAYTHGHTEIVRLILDLPLERGVTARDNEALRFASQNGHTEIVRLLLDLPLERGVNPAANDNYAIRHASIRGHTEIVSMLIDLPPERGVAANVNAALICAIQNGHTEIVSMLIDLPPERGVDPGTGLHNSMCKPKRIYSNCSFAPGFAVGKRSSS